MKRRKWVCALTAFALVCVLALAACGGKNSPPPDVPPPPKVTEGDVCIDLEIAKNPT